MLDTAGSVRNSLKTASLAKKLLGLVEKENIDNSEATRDFFPKHNVLVIKRQREPTPPQSLKNNNEPAEEKEVILNLAAEAEDVTADGQDEPLPAAPFIVYETP